MIALCLAEQRTHEAVVQIDDFVGQRGAGVEDHRDQCCITADRLEVTQVLGSHLSAFSGQLQQAILVDAMFQPVRQPEFPDGLQPLQVYQHMLGLGWAGCLTQPDETAAFGAFADRQQSVESVAVMICQRRGQRLVHLTRTASKGLAARALDNIKRRQDDALLPQHLHQCFGKQDTPVASYRDSFRLLLGYAADRLGRGPTDLQVADLDAELVGDFLSHVEGTRHNGVRTRNARLSAIRSFFKYVAINEPQLLHHCQRILAMPAKRHEKRTIDYLTRPEIEALVAAPAVTTWYGRRDRTLLMVALQTGLRVSELIQLTCGDVALGTGAHVRCVGKGRKERATPLRADCVEALRAWLEERGTVDTEPVFVSNRGERLSRDAVERLVRKHAVAASETCPSRAGKQVTPHVLRHSAAMQLLQNGVDRTVIALWLGHEQLPRG